MFTPLLNITTIDENGGEHKPFPESKRDRILQNIIEKVPLKELKQNFITNKISHRW
jgi:hypothetical protein